MGTGKVAQGLRTLATFAEDQVLFSSTHEALHNLCYSGFRDPVCSPDRHSQPSACGTYIHADKTLIHLKDSMFLKSLAHLRTKNVL